MSRITMRPGGEIALPQEVRDRYGMTPEVPIRLIETRSGVLLVPLTREPMNEELEEELAQWQALSSRTWDLFPYQEKP